RRVLPRRARPAARDPPAGLLLGGIRPATGYPDGVIRDSPSTSWRQRRVDSVDLLRGLVMVIMALDHVRDFFGGTGVSPTNLATTTAPLFFTRWITHICAPLFFLLTGTGAYFAMRRRSPGGLARFLLARGVWVDARERFAPRCS